VKGFFSDHEVKSKSRPGGKTYSCASCGLYKFVFSPRMAPFGEFGKKILNNGEGPGEEEDKKGKQWQGKVGRRLKKTYRHAGNIDLFEDCLNMNAVDCRTPKNREPSDYEVTACRTRKLKTIEQYQPNVIVLLGNAAIKSIIGYKWKSDLDGITRWRGWAIPDREFGAWICPIFHPSYVERNKDMPQVETIWKQDIERMSELVDEPIPKYEDERKQIKILRYQDDLDTVLEKIRLGWEGHLITFDYETTGIKPHAKGHRIVCASIATAENTYAFMFPTKKRDLRQFQNLMESTHIGKTAHNMKFEHHWTETRARHTVNNWVWDSMQAAHLLDNRRKISGLKFQSYVRYGLADYSSHIDPFLQGKDSKDANSHNKIWDFIERYGEDELLIYCGIDSLLEYRLALDQMNELGFDSLIELQNRQGEV